MRHPAQIDLAVTLTIFDFFSRIVERSKKIPHTKFKIL